LVALLVPLSGGGNAAEAAGHAGGSGLLAYTLHLPAGYEQSRTVVLALHGVGGTGEAMLSAVRSRADALGWAVVAPTIPYGDWHDPQRLLSEELWLLPQLIQLADKPFQKAGVPQPRHVLIFGFSRGAQAATRLALFYPHRLQAVAALSAGMYTPPVDSVGAGATKVAAPLPFGVADFEYRVGHALDSGSLRRVRFWIGVGAADNNPNDVPHQWDPYQGANRVERARRFAASQSTFGCEVRLVVLPDTTHQLTAAGVERAMQFLASSAAAATSN
jgi:poly(3-hydroxybutyrate) depolymerase